MADDEPFQMAQAPSPDEMRKARDRVDRGNFPPTPMPSGTAEDDKKLFEGLPPQKSLKAAPTPEQKEERKQKRRDTIGMDRFEVLNTFPKTKEDMRSWVESLSPKHREKVVQFDKFLQANGFTGILDPKVRANKQLSGDMERMFMESSPHWFEQQKRRTRKPVGSPGDPTNPFSPKPRSELKDTPNGVAALGGRMMEEEIDAA